MRKHIRNASFIVALCVGILVVGCASYYKVTDPQTGKEYYTEKVEQERGGAVKLKDARSGSVVTIQNSEVKEISSKEYEAGLKSPVSKPAPAPAAAAPAAAPAPTAAPSAAPSAAPAEQTPASSPTGSK